MVDLARTMLKTARAVVELPRAMVEETRTTVEGGLGNGRSGNDFDEG